MIGKTIGHYQVIDKIGEGGMGVVYRAEDTRLKRTVALKFLPQDLTRSAEARERFIHEAQAASALDHPNICTIYEIDETDEGQVFIVMGLYEGQTLREKIAERPLKLEDAIEITSQIAQGLAKAHEQKIIHRDIKPANIFITNEGQVKVLDFGVAKLAGSTKLTLTGTTLGTVSYMAPEQAKGDEADHKADIWSLGVLMYEMLTGQQPFKGEHEQAVIYSILNEEPEPITAIRTGIPLDLEWVVQKALRKDPRQRYQHIDEIPVDLQNIIESRIGLTPISTVRQQSTAFLAQDSKKRMVPLIGAVLVTVLAAIAATTVSWIINPSKNSTTDSVRHLSAVLPDVELASNQLALSPDGKILVFVAIRPLPGIESSYQLWIRSLDTQEVQPLPGTEGGRSPFFSPDGQWIGFVNVQGQKLMKYSLTTGAIMPIGDVFPGSAVASWGSDDTIIFAAGTQQKVMQISSSGGTPQVVLDYSAEYDSSGWISYGEPEFLPGGKAILLTKSTLDIESYVTEHVAVLSLKNGEITTLIEGASSPRYSPSGHLLYVRNQTLTAAPFSLKRLTLVGPEFVTRERIEGGGYCISKDGLLAFVAYSEEQVRRHLFWVDHDGVATQLKFDLPRTRICPSVSPDGSKIALGIERDVEPGLYDIWVYEADGTSQTRLTFVPNNWRVLWSPDGKYVTFSSDKHGPYNIYSKAASGEGTAELLVESENDIHPVSWSSEPKLLAYYEVSDLGTRDIWILNEDGTSTPFQNTPFDERTPAFSADGKWIAYVSDESGQFEVYVQPRPGLERTGKWQISEGGGTEPLWSPDGDKVYYRMDNRFMAVEVESEPEFRKMGAAQLLFEGTYLTQAWIRGYDIHPNGDKFLMVADAERSKPENIIHIVSNWFEELKRLEGGR